MSGIIYCFIVISFVESEKILMLRKRNLSTFIMNQVTYVDQDSVSKLGFVVSGTGYTCSA
jgi:hypothetical protein